MDRSEDAGLDDITLVLTLPADAEPEAPSVAMRASLQMLRENVEYGDDAVVARVLIAGGADVGARACAVAEVIDPRRCRLRGSRRRARSVAPGEWARRIGQRTPPHPWGIVPTMAAEVGVRRGDRG
jgi:hypothetical protein